MSEGTPYQQLYEEMLLTLEPMTYLPFDLSIDFEIRQAAQAGGVTGGVASSQLQPPGGVANGGGSRKTSLTSVGTPRVMSASPEPSPPMSQVSLRL